MGKPHIYETDDGEIIVPIPLVRTQEGVVHLKFKSVNHLMMELDNPDFENLIVGRADMAYVDERIDRRIIDQYLIPDYYEKKSKED